VTNEGESIENPKVVNLKDPLSALWLHTPSGPVKVDMQKFAEAAKTLGLGEIRKGDRLSIGAFRNAKGEWVPDYSSIRIERKAPPVEDDE
jgi:hypothetical protein